MTGTYCRGELDSACDGIIDLEAQVCNNAHRKKAPVHKAADQDPPMQFHVLRELRQTIGTVNTFAISQGRWRADDVELRDLGGTVTLLRTDRGLLVKVAASATAAERCSRCLSAIQCAVEIAFEEEYVPVIDANTGMRIVARDEPDLFRIGPDFVLDLREGMRQYFLMTEPLKPLCRDDCAGLCPHCGANLNEGQCGCVEMGDERWQALRALKEVIEEGSQERASIT